MQWDEALRAMSCTDDITALSACPTPTLLLNQIRAPQFCSSDFKRSKRDERYLLSLCDVLGQAYGVANL